MLEAIAQARNKHYQRARGGTYSGNDEDSPLDGVAGGDSPTHGGRSGASSPAHKNKRAGSNSPSRRNSAMTAIERDAWERKEKSLAVVRAETLRMEEKKEAQQDALKNRQ